ncbi:type VII secretion target [Actinoplanes sp. NEAU-A12]|uniref:Type VII secretion target n=1 Tax=Actinoplanes sandaracinus TaxID=3045177 RepID=A0ABT6X269_9ACTN|nr:type VII secretion target [Actinoplanes sandaracinus]MDI6106009.1 type VII secretion target [Actinoplanes sandaracinus]
MQVDPAALDTAAQQVSDLGQRWASSVADVEPETQAAAAGLTTGFRMRRAITEFSSAMSVDVRMFDKHLQELGAALAQTAGDYRRSDTASGNRFWYVQDNS